MHKTPFDQSAQWLNKIQATQPGFYHELVQNNQLKPSWQYLFEHIGRDNPERMSHKLSNESLHLKKQLHDNGITYNVYAADKKKATRPWTLDILPQIIEYDDWLTLSQATIQRARLLNALMADAYTHRKVLAQGILAAELLFGHSDYLPELQNLNPVNGIWLHRLAFDFGRTLDGRWWMLSHRVQNPSGMGYALENRASISKIFKRAYRDLNVAPLLPFFSTYLDNLSKLSPKGENARIALLSPGPENETYFEHAYLVRYLGITLVEAGDLTVRKNKVYLKTVHGLEQIDVLFRRTLDRTLDPLEFHSDIIAGVPGLIQAARNHNIVLINLPGSAWLESPGLHGFMPKLCDTLLGETLTIPSVPSWWCGEPAALNEASINLSQLVIRYTYPDANGRRLDAIMGSHLNDKQKSRWLKTIHADPAQFTLQELIPLSHTTTWGAHGPENQSMMLRMFAVTDGLGNYSVMPGGLTRVSGTRAGIVAMRHGGSSKDTWVRQPHQIQEPSHAEINDKLTMDDLLSLSFLVSSRIAEHLFWLGRYTERAHFSLRLMTKVQTLLTDDEDIDDENATFLHELCAEQGLTKPVAGDHSDQDTLESELISRFLFDSSQPEQSITGMVNTFKNLASCAMPLRDRLSSGHWRLLTEIGQLLDANSTTYKQDLNQLDNFLYRIRLYLDALHGEQSEHMTQDTGWYFLQLGCQLERFICALDVLQTLMKNIHRINPIGLSICVDLADSTITYRSRYRHRFEWLPTIHLLVFDEDMPYSLACMVNKIKTQLQHLPSGGASATMHFEKYFPNGQLPAHISLQKLSTIKQPQTQLLFSDWLTNVYHAASTLSNLIGAQYFRLSEKPEQIIQERQ